jgi:hypothetical protein
LLQSELASRCWPLLRRRSISVAVFAASTRVALAEPAFVVEVVQFVFLAANLSIVRVVALVSVGSSRVRETLRLFRTSMRF